MNDAEASKLLYDNIKDDVIKSKDILYIRHNNIWESNYEDLLINKLFNMKIKKYQKATDKEQMEIDPALLIEYNGIQYHKYKYEDYSTILNHAKNIIKSLKAIMPNSNNFEKLIYTTTKGKIAFNNGYYDFNKKQFVNNFNNVYFTNKLNRDYKENFINDNQEIIEEINNRLLEPILGKNKKDYLISIARMIAGYTNDKCFYIVLGERDSGKSKLKNIVENAFQNYIGTVNMNSLLLNNSNTDENLKLNWLVDSWDKRIIFGSEVRLDKNSRLDGNLIKSLCSGTDIIKMRNLREKPKDYFIQCSLMMFSNDLPKIDPEDTYEKLRSFTCPHKFVKHITNEDSINNPHFRIADNNIDEFVFNEKVAEAFTYIIINSFDELPKLTEEQHDFIENIKTGDLINEFFEKFTITRNNNDKIFLKDIKEYLNISQLNISMAKLSLMLQNRGVLYKKSLKIGGKVASGFIGIKRNTIEEETKNDLDI